MTNASSRVRVIAIHAAIGQVDLTDGDIVELVRAAANFERSGLMLTF